MLVVNIYSMWKEKKVSVEENNTGSNINIAYRCAVSQIFKPFSLYICKHSPNLTFLSLKFKIHMSFLIIKKVEN